MLTSALFALSACNSKEKKHEGVSRSSELNVNDLGIVVTAKENREYSFTDKRSGYWYARTSQQQHSGMFDGWTVMRQHIFNDYSLFVNKKELLRKVATVYPNKIVRSYSTATETFAMLDNVEALVVLVDVKDKEDNISISFTDDLKFKYYNETDDILVFSAKDVAGKFVGVSSISPAEINSDNGRYSVSSDAKGFFIFLVNSENELSEMSKNLQGNYDDLLSRRASRMDEIIRDDIYIESNNSEFDKTLQWVSLTLDELVTNQMGHGIYAGLPWFNDYWGRDMFISLPGSNLVTGQFDIAKEILLSFARYQLTDENSKYYGRIPNRARPDDVIYNTTDGTPRFVIQVFDYVKYTGDTDLISELYPVIFRSIDGSLKNWVDSKGYLTHEDADTWMDAKRRGHAFSPRGNRANDIQILWYQQLRAGAYFAKFMGNNDDAKKWSEVADKLKSNFEKDYFKAGESIMADRLLKNGKGDFSMRPNQLFAMDFMTDETKKMQLTKTVWENLVYPWGVASLDQDDDYFHPYHHWDDMYFFDEAYHNGTVWVWNNGIAMQRMIESGQKDIAFKLMENMQNQAMHTGAVGSISENFDALPRDGKSYADKTGTFLQAWSNAEFLRVWYQNFMGIRPNAISGELTIAPRIPSKFNEMKFSEKLMGGNICGEYHFNEGNSEFKYVFREIKAKVLFDLEGFENITIDVIDGDIVSISLSANDPKIEIYQDGSEIKTHSLLVSKLKQDMQNISNDLFKGVDFVKPKLNKESFIFRRKAKGEFDINVDK